MKIKSRYSGVVVVFLAYSHLTWGQAEVNIGNVLKGKWKMEIMRDTAGYAFDFITSEKVVPIVFPYLTLNAKNKGILSDGKAKYKMKWSLSTDSIFFRLNDGLVRSYKTITIKENELVLGLTIEMDDGSLLNGLVYYKRE
ncbi:MAG TPA: hypothetical protein DIW47_10310 [Bacteroidetes bacterium]|nr:hypothetical protein [Bacteroidota bacterium]